MSNQSEPQPYERKRAFDFSGMSKGRKTLNIALIVGGAFAFPPIVFVYIALAVYYRIKYRSSKGNAS